MFYWLEIFLIGVALSMDALAVSLALGATEGPRMDGKKVLLVALFFGGFQALMPLLGWFGGQLFGEYVLRFGSIISAGLLWLVGGKMLWDQNSEQQISFGLGKLFSLAFATSIDAFLVGISFACRGKNSILMEILLIGVTTFVISAAGCLAGKYSRKLFGKYSAPLGGIVLIAIGLKILIFG